MQPCALLRTFHEYFALAVQLIVGGEFIAVKLIICKGFIRFVKL